MPKKTSDDDIKLFHDAMQDVRPLKHKNKIFHAKKVKKVSIRKPFTEEEKNTRHLSDHELVSVTSDETLSYRQPGISQQYFKELSKGSLKIEDHIDLHGYTVDEARDELQKFIQFALDHQFRVVKIIHGKGHSDNQNLPILKNKINTWLQQMPEILAFCSALPKDGGKGAVYVLLKKEKI